jgi:hypothetical protein
VEEVPVRTEEHGEALVGTKRGLRPEGREARTGGGTLQPVRHRDVERHREPSGEASVAAEIDTPEAEEPDRRLAEWRLDGRVSAARCCGESFQVGGGRRPGLGALRATERAAPSDRRLELGCDRTGIPLTTGHCAVEHAERGGESPETTMRGRVRCHPVEEGAQPGIREQSRERLGLPVPGESGPPLAR